MAPFEPHVIVVDADGSYAGALASAFAQLQCRVSTPGDAESALALAAKDMPDLVVVSAELPKTNGLVVCNKLKRDATLKSVPVVVVVGSTAENLIDEHKPISLGVERLFFNKNVMTAFAVGQARGVVLLAAAERGLPVFEYGPHEVKMAVTGYGRSEKAQVQKMVQLMLGMSVLPKPDDAADALAVAICLAHSSRPA